MRFVVVPLVVAALLLAGTLAPVRAQVESGTLVPVLREYSGALSVFRALWPSGGQLTPKMRAFVDFMSVHLFPVEATTKAHSRSD